MRKAKPEYHATPSALAHRGYTFRMELGLNNKIFRLPNARRMIVEPFGVRITDKAGNTILESGRRRELCFDRSLSEDDRRLLSELKIRR